MDLDLLVSVQQWLGNQGRVPVLISLVSSLTMTMRIKKVKNNLSLSSIRGHSYPFSLIMSSLAFFSLSSHKNQGPAMAHNWFHRLVGFRHS